MAPGRTGTFATVPRVNPRTRLLLIVALMIVSAALSATLLLQHHGDPLVAGAVAQVCGEGEQSGCDVVNRSSWSEVAGVPLAAIGLVFALSLALLALLGSFADEEAQLGAAAVLSVLLGLALVADLALLGIQAFALRAFCRLCLATYALNAAALFVAWPR